jgi:predicted DNA-binding ribbon-helix-helix protein
VSAQEASKAPPLALRGHRRELKWTHECVIRIPTRTSTCDYSIFDTEECLSGLIKRSFSLAGHRTSVALEPEFWEVLMRMAQARGQSLSALVAAVDAAREPNRPLASALRVMALTAER